MKPTLEEVKAYFKNAKEVKSLFGDKFILEDLSLIGFSTLEGADGVYYDKGKYQVYHEEKGYAQIISYKDEPLTVSKEFILDLHKDVVWPTVKAKIEKAFPSVFVKDELEVGKWYKSPEFGSSLFRVTKINGNYATAYGFNFVGKWQDEKDEFAFSHLENKTLATPEEVETALINEAKKRGLYGNISIITPYDGTERRLKDNGSKFNYFENEKECYLTYYGWRVFQNGKWATIIEQPTKMTVAEIEEKLGLKVKIVG